MLFRILPIKHLIASFAQFKSSVNEPHYIRWHGNFKRRADSLLPLLVDYRNPDASEPFIGCSLQPAFYAHAIICL